jgi:hypothetical protein
VHDALESDLSGDMAKTTQIYHHKKKKGKKEKKGKKGKTKRKKKRKERDHAYSTGSALCICPHRVKTYLGVFRKH